MEIRAFAAAVSRHWRIALSALLLGLLTSIGVLLTSTPVFTSSTQLFLTTPGWGGPTTLGNSDSSPFQGDEFSQQRAQTYVRLIQNDDFAIRVSQRLGGAVDSSAVQAHLEARVVPDTVIVEVTAGSASATTARDITTAAAAELTDNIETLEVPAGTLIPTVQPVSIGSPTLPSSPSSPRTGLTLLLGGTLGLLAGLSAVVVRVRSVSTVDDAVGAAAVLGAPVLGALPAPGAPDVKDRFDELRYNLEYLAPRFSSGILLVSSVHEDDGKTTTVDGLAAAYARAGRSVITVDTDLRDPAGTGHTLGLSNIVAGDVTIARTVATTSHGVATMSSGARPNEPSMLLESQRLIEVLQELEARYDVVILDSPDLARFNDARTLARSARATLVVVASGVAASSLKDAAEALRAVGVTPSGAVLTHAGRVGSRFGYIAPAETTPHDDTRDEYFGDVPAADADRLVVAPDTETVTR